MSTLPVRVERIREASVCHRRAAQGVPFWTVQEGPGSMGAIVKSYLKSLLVLAAAAVAVATVMWIVVAILTFDLGAFLNGLH